MRVALDSNVLVYSAGVIKTPQDRAKKDFARLLIDAIDTHAHVVCPLQTFGEAFSVMHRFGHSREKCREKLNEWGSRFETIGSGASAYSSAFDLATEHKWQFWDALILSVAAEADCAMLLSEDLDAGFAWRGVVVVNPFDERLDARLARLLKLSA